MLYLSIILLSAFSLFSNGPSTKGALVVSRVRDGGAGGCSSAGLTLPEPGLPKRSIRRGLSDAGWEVVSVRTEG